MSIFRISNKIKKIIYPSMAVPDQADLASEGPHTINVIKMRRAKGSVNPVEDKPIMVRIPSKMYERVKLMSKTERMTIREITERAYKNLLRSSGY
jgi:hypothetical protein